MIKDVRYDLIWHDGPHLTYYEKNDEKWLGIWSIPIRYSKMPKPINDWDYLHSRITNDQWRALVLDKCDLRTAILNAQEWRISDSPYDAQQKVEKLDDVWLPMAELYIGIWVPLELNIKFAAEVSANLPKA
jgi:hypothetical protein